MLVFRRWKELEKGCHPVERCVIDFGYVSSRIFWIKLKFSRVKVCVVVGYGPNEEDGEERDRF